MEDKVIIAEQLAYYRARAHEYDEWFYRRGRYDRGPVHRAEWFREVNTIQTTLSSLIRGKSILELACGTGLWTHFLAEHCQRILAVDASPEVISINRDRQQTRNIEYRVTDIFEWVPDGGFDVVFFSFWLSHVPTGRFNGFWKTVGRALTPQGSVFFIDSLPEQMSTARDHGLLDRSGVVRRKLNDGREFQIVKVFYEPSALQRQLAEQGWRGWVRSTGKFFLYGLMEPTVTKG